MDHWRRGIACFNQGQYWEAHHGWEKDWNRLPSPAKEEVQALILSCGVFYHLQKEHPAPALALCRLAQERWREGALRAANEFEFQPRIDVPGLRGLIDRIRSELAEPEVAWGSVPASGWVEKWQAQAEALRATLVGE